MADDKKMKCFNLKTGELQGYLGTEDLYVKIKTFDHAAAVQWYRYGDALYLDEEIKGEDRYLSNNWGQAKWETWSSGGGAKLDFNADGSISLTDSPSRKLYYKPTTSPKEIWFTHEDETDSNKLDNILKFESGLVVTHDWRLSAGATKWEHSMDAGKSWGWLELETPEGGVEFCNLEIPHDTMQLKLKIHNDCGRDFQVIVSKDGVEDPAFASPVINKNQCKSLVFDVSGVSGTTTLPYYIAGVYLDDKSRVPDPKFTITRKSGG